MTKRELNKLPAGGLTVAHLDRLGLKELMNLVLHCFAKWKDEQFKRTFYKKEVKAWDAAHQKNLAINKEFFEENKRLEEERSKLAQSNARWYREADHYKVAYDSLLVIYDESEAENEQLRAENQQLKQHLATHLVPVPGNPGMSFISYPN